MRDIGKCPDNAECIWNGEKVYQLLVIDEGINLKEVSTVTNRNTKTKSLNLKRSSASPTTESESESRSVVSDSLQPHGL